LKILFKFTICGLLTSLIFPPFFLLPIGFAVFPFLFFLLTNNSYINKNKIFHFNSGLFYGIGLNFIVLIWIKQPFSFYTETNNLSFISLLLIIYCSIYYGIVFWVLSFIKNNLSKIILMPVLFIIVEIFRDKFFFGFPWIKFAEAYSSNELLLALIYFFGTNGIGYTVILLFLVPSIIFIYYTKKYKNNFSFFYLFFSFFVIFFSTALIFYKNINTNDNQNESFKISLAQLNFSLKDKINNKNPEERLLKINDIINDNNSDLLVFAENDFPFLIQEEKELELISKNLKKNQTIILGGTRKENNKFFNTFITIEKDNIKFFDKIILVPFGEFLPLRNLFSFFDFIVGSFDFSIGEKERIILTSNDLKILPIICYEIIFYENLLNKNNIDSKIMINITNDSWFGNLSGPYQHFYISRMRAVEFNKPLIRVSNNGISAIINQNGKIISNTNLNEETILDSKILILEQNNNLVNYHFAIYILFFIFGTLALLINKKYND